MLLKTVLRGLQSKKMSFTEYHCRKCKKVFGDRKSIRQHLKEEHFMKRDLSENIKTFRLSSGIFVIEQ